jgi:hypothetical protein
MNIEKFRKASAILNEIDHLKGNSFTKAPNYDKISKGIESLKLSSKFDDFYIDDINEHPELKEFISSYLLKLHSDVQKRISELEEEFENL